MSKFYGFLLLSTAFMLPAVNVMAEETEDFVEEATSSLKANLNRIAVQYNQNSVTNKDEQKVMCCLLGKTLGVKHTTL